MKPRTRMALGAATAFLVVGAALMAKGCALADLRPQTMIDAQPDAEAQRLGKQRLLDLAESHGGLEQWRDRKTATIVLRDTWDSALERAAVMPWPENSQKIRQVIALGTDTSRMEMIGGPQPGLQWGLQDWQAYTVEPGGEPVFEESFDVTFWLPTVAYFFEAPFRLWEADVAVAMEPAEIDGRVYDRVFATWGVAGPQDKIDQYIVWIDRETGLLHYLEYTVRDFFPFIVGRMAFRDYRNAQGFKIAATMATVAEVGGEDKGHRFDFEAIQFGSPVDPDHLYPAR